MSDSELKEQLADALASLRSTQEELAQTQRGLLALAMELEERVDERTAELRKSNTLLQAEISDRKKMEEALRVAGEDLARVNAELEHKVEERTARLRETLGELEAFSYSLSHDLRGPLRAITGFNEILLGTYRDRLDKEAVMMLEKVLKASRRMDQLITDVLVLSRLSRTELRAQPIDLEALLRQIIQDRPDLQPPRARVQIQSPLKLVSGDEASLTQCLANLLGNAVKYVKKGVVPEVRIWTETIGCGIRGIEASSRVRLWVADNGIGIAPEYHHKIFEIFLRLHTQDQYEGTGIGLAIVRKAVERMGGKVGVESQAGQGSSFWLELQQA